jgi:hypothetical protein
MAKENNSRLLFTWGVSQVTSTMKSLGKALQSSVFSVKVENPIDNTTLMKEVAQNTRGVKGKLEELIKKPALTFSGPIQARLETPIEFPKTIEVSNQPKEVIVSNLKDIKIDIPQPIVPEKIDLLPLEKAVKDLKTSFSDVARQLPSLKPDPVVIPKYPEQKPFPKELSMTEGKDIVEEVQGLRADIEQLYKLLETKEFGGEGSGKVEVTNFPPQHIPTPVTNININSLKGSVKTTAVTVTSAATLLPDTALSQRRSLIIYNVSSNTIYVGGSDVSTSNGIPILAGATSPSIDAGDQMKLYGIASSPSAVRIFEVSNNIEGN